VPKREVAPIIGLGIRLRLLAPTDLERTLAWRNRDENRRWFLHAEPIAGEQHATWYRGYAGRDDDFVFIIEDLEDAGAPIGQVALYRIDWGLRVAEFGRLLIGEPSARGKGLGLRATRSMLDFGFGAWGLHRVHLEVFAHNDRAIRIYEDCGFRPVGARGEVLAMELPRAHWIHPTRGRVA
jgi:RimJ/RimL family protein N-acetyltransferase